MDEKLIDRVSRGQFSVLAVMLPLLVGLLTCCWVSFRDAYVLTALTASTSTAVYCWVLRRRASAATDNGPAHAGAPWILGFECTLASTLTVVLVMWAHLWLSERASYFRPPLIASILACFSAWLRVANRFRRRP